LRRARQSFGVGIDEFARQWFAGAYGNDVNDTPAALELAMLLPIIGLNPWDRGDRT